MMGSEGGQGKLFRERAISLEGRVRSDNPLRRVKELVDFSFVRGEVAGFYGPNGNVSVAPEVIMKMMFLLFHDDVSSERELMRTIPERLDYMWFLGYDLDDDIPDHSVLSKARARWGLEVFERLFVTTVERCVAAGLVGGAKIHVDSSLVEANASKDSVRKGSPELVEALRRVYLAQERKLDEARPAGGGAGDDDEGAGGEAGGGHEPVNKGLVSTTDPEAGVVRIGSGDSRPRYRHHRAVDDASGVVTAVETTSGDVRETGLLMEMVAKHEANASVRVETVVADAGYGTVENFRRCAARGIEPHMADLAAAQKAKGARAKIYDESRFTYDKETDTYACPAGRTLRRRRHKKGRMAYEYAAGAKTCGACARRAECTRSTSGRSVKRHADQEVIDAARAKARSPAAKADRRRRRHLMEGSFADAATNHGFKRARWRGLWRQSVQDLLIAAVQNVRLLARYDGRLRRAAARALDAADRAAKALCRLFARPRSPARHPRPDHRPACS